jgi:haloacid dehalogenase superfamily, subfamily IA, variant 1 with third motif having Dx(3-4)D or Dx(3-4)E
MNNYPDIKTSPNFTSVIFDFDYTLADSSKGVIKCVNYALKTMNLQPASNSEIRTTIGMSLREIFQRLTRGSRENRSDEFSRLFTAQADKVMLEKIVLFDSVKPAIEQLLRRGLTLGIVSTKYRYRIEAFLKREGLNHAFQVIVGGEDVTIHKPDPTGLLMATAKLGTKSSNHCVYVGDSVVDAETAHRAAIPFVAVLSGVTTKDAFRDYDPIAVIDNLSQLPSVLSKN